jgi:hypothetical protein
MRWAKRCSAGFVRSPCERKIGYQSLPLAPDRVRVNTVVPAIILKVLFQSEVAAAKSNFVPGNVGRRIHSGCQRFFAGGVSAEQFCGKEKMQLARLRHVNGREQVANFHFGTGLFQSFAGGAFCYGFVEFHEACGYRPVTVTGFDGAFAQQYLAVQFRDAAHYDQRILVMNRRAFRTDPAFAIVAFRYNAIDQGSTA